jgi:hypothetical protein
MAEGTPQGLMTTVPGLQADVGAPVACRIGNTISTCKSQLQQCNCYALVSLPPEVRRFMGSRSAWQKRSDGAEGHPTDGQHRCLPTGRGMYAMQAKYYVIIIVCMRTAQDEMASKVRVFPMMSKANRLEKIPSREKETSNGGQHQPQLEGRFRKGTVSSR